MKKLFFSIIFDVQITIKSFIAKIAPTTKYHIFNKHSRKQSFSAIAAFQNLRTPNEWIQYFYFLNLSIITLLFRIKLKCMKSNFNNLGYFLFFLTHFLLLFNKTFCLSESHCILNGKWELNCNDRIKNETPEMLTKITNKQTTKT